MSGGWRRLALVVGAILGICGIALWLNGGGPFLLVFAAIVLITALLEPIYGRANGAPRGIGWRPTDERFIDPESGKLVTVWFDPASGERRYVSNDEAQGPRS
jgi:hypothetical protein